MISMSPNMNRAGAVRVFATNRVRPVRGAWLTGWLLAMVAAGAWAADPPSEVADAVERQDAQRVRELLARHVDPNGAQVDGMTALHWAVWFEQLDLTRELLAAGANAAASNRYGVRPLSLACTNGNTALVEILLDAGADPNASLPGGETPLMTAARTGRIEPVHTLVSRGANIDAREHKGQTALMWAAAEGHADVVARLLDAGADFRTPLRSGFTPFFFAVRDGRTAAVQRLLAAGADVNDVMQPETSSEKGPVRGMSALVLAVENGHFELARLLLKAGADPNDQRSGFTALHTLTWVRKPNRGDGADGDPAPRGSGNLSSLELVRELVAHGADVNTRLERGAAGRGKLNRKGATALLLAAATADAPLIRALVELGADPLLPNTDGCTPLMAAAGIGTLAPGEEAGTEPEAIECLKLLLSLGADVNTVDENGETAMHGAAYKSLPKVVAFLADSGADLGTWNRENKYGWTPLVIAHGYRPGNFKPSVETIAALRQVLLAGGVTPPENPRPSKTDAKDY